MKVANGVLFIITGALCSLAYLLPFDGHSIPYLAMTVCLIAAGVFCFKKDVDKVRLFFLLNLCIYIVYRTILYIILLIRALVAGGGARYFFYVLGYGFSEYALIVIAFVLFIITTKKDNKAVRIVGIVLLIVATAAQVTPSALLELAFVLGGITPLQYVVNVSMSEMQMLYMIMACITYILAVERLRNDKLYGGVK